MNFHRIWRSVLFLFCGLFLMLPPGFSQRQTNKQTPTATPVQPAGCDQLGWYSAGVGLKDHTVFFFDGFYYLASIRLPSETSFAYSRSRDLCHWTDLGPILDRRPARKWDEAAIWAPFVLEEDGIYYMYYTGVSHEFTQSIMLAISTNPADPDSWQTEGMVFYPNHPGALWGPDRWADCRDATILKVDQIYYLYYTGRDSSGPILGWATAFSPAGPWLDWGATMTLENKRAMVESPVIVDHDGLFYLLYNNTSKGEEYRIAFSQIGPWSDPLSFRPGWANEVWVGQDGLAYTSYVKNYAIAIEPIHFNNLYNRLLFFIDANIKRQYFPLLLNP